MSQVRKIRFTTKPTTLREKELVQQYTKLLRQQHKKYQTLHKYNERLYAQYSGLHEVINASIKKEPDSVEKRDAFKIIRDAFILPFHPLRDK
jgi:hypothetical protein